MLTAAHAGQLPLADGSVQCVVTSPPYWGLRKYAGEQERIWPLSDRAIESLNCAHEWVTSTRPLTNPGRMMPHGDGRPIETDTYAQERMPYPGHQGVVRGTCVKCGAWRGAYGLEPTVEMYVAHTVEILREVRRVLRDDGVCFWNLGDSYAGSWSRSANPGGRGGLSKMQASNNGSYSTVNVGCPPTPEGLKPKDLCLIPERVALAAQADGWWVRSLIVWAKPNPMPESVTDRPTDAYEFILMLTKSPRYFWDAEAVKEPAEYGRSEWRGDQWSASNGIRGGYQVSPGNGGWRNLRNVWTFATQPYSGAHFATFPEELPRRCILAATSAKGACAQCGAPWQRVVSDQRPATGEESWKGSQFDTGKTAEHQGERMQVRSGKNEQSGIRTIEGFNARWDEKETLSLETRTVGWRPTCACRGQRGMTVPCAVLDPFGGSGTTGRVALELNRRAVLVDLAYGGSTETDKADYAELADRRTSHVQRQLAGL